jgi:hypothetical protein
MILLTFIWLLFLWLALEFILIWLILRDVSKNDKPCPGPVYGPVVGKSERANTVESPNFYSAA